MKMISVLIDSDAFGRFDLIFQEKETNWFHCFTKFVNISIKLLSIFEFQFEWQMKNQGEQIVRQLNQ